MKKIYLITLFCFVVLSGICLAKHPGMNICHEAVGIPPGKWWQAPDIAKDLNLTTDEQKQLDNLYSENLQKTVDL